MTLDLDAIKARLAEYRQAKKWLAEARKAGATTADLADATDEHIDAGNALAHSFDEVGDSLLAALEAERAENARLRKIEDAALRYVEACGDGAYIGEMMHNLECVISENPRPSDR